MPERAAKRHLARRTGCCSLKTFHFADAPANRLTNRALDSECGITELKACAARIETLP